MAIARLCALTTAPKSGFFQGSEEIKNIFEKIEIKTWDAKTNPFEHHSEIARIHELAEGKKTEFLLYQELRRSFAASFLNEYQTEAAKTPVNQNMQNLSALWAKRMSGLAHVCQETDKNGQQIESSAIKNFSISVADLLESIFVQDLFCNLKAPRAVLEIWVHQAFARPFSAVAPTFFVFIDRLEGLDLFSAGRLIHELTHVKDGLERGWNSFQQSTFTEIEQPALIVEKSFVKHHCKNNKWKTSAERYFWNLGFATGAEEIGYLNILNEIDPA